MPNNTPSPVNASSTQTPPGDEVNSPGQLKTSTLFVAWLFAGPLNPLWLAVFFTEPSYEGSEVVHMVATASPFISGVTALIVVMLLSHKAAPSYNMIWRTWLKVFTPIGLFILTVFAIVLLSHLFFLALFALPVVALVIAGAGLAASFAGAFFMHLVFSVMERR